MNKHSLIASGTRGIPLGSSARSRSIHELHEQSGGAGPSRRRRLRANGFRDFDLPVMRTEIGNYLGLRRELLMQWQIGAWPVSVVLRLPHSTGGVFTGQETRAGPRGRASSGSRRPGPVR